MDGSCTRMTKPSRPGLLLFNAGIGFKTAIGKVWQSYYEIVEFRTSFYLMVDLVKSVRDNP